MTKYSFISLAVLILNDGQAAAFSTTRGVKSSSLYWVGQSRISRNYKQSHEDENAAASSDSFGWRQEQQRDATASGISNGTDPIFFNDFQIRESDQSPSEENSVAVVEQRAAVEPGSKPTKRFISPIQMMKLVPKVQPVTNSSVFFVASAVDPKAETKANTIPDQSTSRSKSNGMKPKWSPRKKWSTTAFQSTNYLESLSSSAAEGQQDDDSKSLMASLRNQQGAIRQEKLRSTQEAMQAAMRRTNPQEAIMNRIAKAEELRKQKEIEKLEKLYVERKERLDAKKRLEREAKLSLERYTEERKRVDRVKEEMEKERMENDDADSMVDGAAVEVPPAMDKVKRGIPILGPFLKKSQSSPLIIGNTISLQYDNMTPFQIKTLEVAQSLHQEHCRKMKEEMTSAGQEGGIEAAPIVAIIDTYTGSTESSRAKKVKSKRFATLAAVEVVEKNGEPKVVHLMGVGRVFLHTYFSSKDAGLTKEEEELSKLLQMIHDRMDNEKDIYHQENEEDDDLPIIMAEFDLFLDDSSILSRLSKRQEVSKQRVSSMHGVTELYRTANKVYRLHEERKKLLSGLRAGQARLNFREKMENEVIEYDDWSDVEAYSIENDVIQDYGFGTYGIFSTIPDLTKELMSRLEPYYSAAHREREEYEAEVASFVVLRALEKYADPSELAAALVAPSATERLDMAYDIMSRHREELVVLVDKMNDDLKNCGEECADLW